MNLYYFNKDILELISKINSGENNELIKGLL